MRKHFHRFALIILFLFVGVNIFGSAQVYADPAGGGFNVPQINDEFNKGKQAPPPQQEESVAQSSQEEDGFWKNVWDWTTGTVSKGWEKTKETVTNAWESTKEGVASAWNWTVDTATKGWNWAVDTATKAWNWTVDALTAAWEWTKDTAVKAWNWVKAETVRMIVTTIAILATIYIGLKALRQSVLTTLANRKQQAVNWARTQYNRFVNWFKNLIGIDTSRPHGRLEDVKVNDRVLANASQLVYLPDSFIEANVKVWLEDKNWEVAEKVNLKNDLQAYTFVNDNTHEVIIAFRGTQEFKDKAIADVAIAFGLDILNPQLHSARDFVEGVLNNPRYKGYQFVLTGHSLGGYLANDVGAKYNIPTLTFNAAGKNLFPNVNASTVAPAALGTVKAGPAGTIAGAQIGVRLTGATYVINMIDPENRKHAINEFLGNDDDLIRNYNFNHDLVGGVGFRSGETYFIDEKGNYVEEEGLDNDLVNLNFDAGSTHTIKNFTGKTDKGGIYNSPISEIIYKHNGNIVPR